MFPWFAVARISQKRSLAFATGGAELPRVSLQSNTVSNRSRGFMLPVFALLLTATVTIPAAAQSDADVRAAVDRLAPRMIEIRHDIHQHPELGNRETRTAELVATELRRLGLEVRTGVAQTGVVGMLRGGKPGPVVAIRADMDALPVTEQSDLPFRSVVTADYLGRQVGVSHACGHDTHVAAQLGVANVLAGMKDKLPGTVIFIFQPAEEGPPPGEKGGAELMVAEGAFAEPKPRPDPRLPRQWRSARRRGRRRAARPGGLHARGRPWPPATQWTAQVIGRQAHGAYPHLGIDASGDRVAGGAGAADHPVAQPVPLLANVVTVGRDARRGPQQHHRRRDAAGGDHPHLRRRRSWTPSSAGCGRSSTASPGRPGRASPSSSTAAPGDGERHRTRSAVSSGAGAGGRGRAMCVRRRPAPGPRTSPSSRAGAGILPPYRRGAGRGRSPAGTTPRPSTPTTGPCRPPCGS